MIFLSQPIVIYISGQSLLAGQLNKQGQLVKVVKTAYTTANLSEILVKLTKKFSSKQIHFVFATSACYHFTEVINTDEPINDDAIEQKIIQNIPENVTRLKYFYQVKNIDRKKYLYLFALPERISQVLQRLTDNKVINILSLTTDQLLISPLIKKDGQVYLLFHQGLDKTALIFSEQQIIATFPVLTENLDEQISQVKNILKNQFELGIDQILIDENWAPDSAKSIKNPTLSCKVNLFLPLLFYQKNPDVFFQFQNSGQKPSSNTNSFLEISAGQLLMFMLLILILSVMALLGLWYLLRGELIKLIIG